MCALHHALDRGTSPTRAASRPAAPPVGLPRPLARLPRVALATVVTGLSRATTTVPIPATSLTAREPARPCVDANSHSSARTGGWSWGGVTDQDAGPAVAARANRCSNVCFVGTMPSASSGAAGRPSEASGTKSRPRAPEGAPGGAKVNPSEARAGRGGEGRAANGAEDRLRGDGEREPRAGDAAGRAGGGDAAKAWLRMPGACAGGAVRARLGSVARAPGVPRAVRVNATATLGAVVTEARAGLGLATPRGAGEGRASEVEPVSLLAPLPRFDLISSFCSLL